MTQSEVHSLQERMVTLLLINLLIAVVAPQVFTLYGGIIDYLIAYAAGLVVLLLADRRYGRVTFWSIVFVVYVFWEMILANIALAWLILQPRPNFHPAILAIPLRVNTGLEITMLASAITLTPATLSLELMRDADGRLTLYVHGLQVEDAGQMRAKIQNGFECLILLIMRGTDR